MIKCFVLLSPNLGERKLLAEEEKELRRVQEKYNALGALSNLGALSE
jgi:hypothetical protein